MDMADQLAIGADHGVRTDDAIGANGRPLADHSAVFNPRGGIDHGHQRRPDWRLSPGDIMSGFPVVTATARRLSSDVWLRRMSSRQGSTTFIRTFPFGAGSTDINGRNHWSPYCCTLTSCYPA